MRHLSMINRKSSRKTRILALCVSKIAFDNGPATAHRPENTTERTGLGAKTEENRGSYVPVMGHYRLLPLYDLLQGLLGVAPAHQTLIDQADMRPGQGVLEIGCGTEYLGQLEPLRAVIHSASIHLARTRGQQQAGDHEVPRTVHRPGGLEYPCSPRPP
jgi:hypothetical protein